MNSSSTAEQILPDKYRTQVGAEVLSAMRAALETPMINGTKLGEAMRYSTLSSGKLLRPQMFYALYRDLGGSEFSRVAAVGVALEFLHVASLIHDDLPALDNDTLRRGQKTCHLQFDEATAILAGDTLVPLAINLVLKSELDVKQRAVAAEILSETFVRLCQGQQFDLLPLEEQISFESIARLKTGALFSASLSLSAVVLDCSQEVVTIASELGSDFGVAFQIADDIADSSSADERFARKYELWKRLEQSITKKSAQLAAFTKCGEIFYTKDIFALALPDSI